MKKQINTHLACRVPCENCKASGLITYNAHLDGDEMITVYCPNCGGVGAVEGMLNLMEVLDHWWATKNKARRNRNAT